MKLARRRVSGQALTEYVLLVMFVIVGLLVVLIEFQDVLVRLYQTSVSLIYCTFP